MTRPALANASCAVALVTLVAVNIGCGSAPQPGGAGSAAPDRSGQRSTRYEDLVSLFTEWRAFQRPTLVNGVPDYSAAAMAAQHKALAGYQARLAAIDPSGWPIPQQVDYHIVRAEMNGLDFDHRVLRPWANNPAFYVTIFPSESDQPAREGPFAYGAVELWSYPFPLSAARRRGHRRRACAPCPRCWRRRRTNLIGNGKDLWVHGARDMRAAERGPRSARGAVDGIRQQRWPETSSGAKAATDEFAAWLEKEAAAKTGPSGVGVDNYDWYLRHVMLLPYTLARLVTLMERELARAHSSLALEEARNAALPPQTADRLGGGTRAALRRRRDRVHRVSARPPDHDGARLHGAGAAGAHRPVLAGPTRVLHRGRLPRSAK